MERLMSFLGLVALLGIAFAFSTHHRRVNWRTVVMGTLLQLALGFFLLKFKMTADAFAWLTDRITLFLNLSDKGAEFLFGDLAKTAKFGYVFAFRVIPTIIFFSAFISIMYYLGVVQVVTGAMASVMQWTMRTSGAETLASAVNVFVGQTEAPLLIKPYLARMTESELHCVMVGGFANIAGGVLAAYVNMGIPAQHLIISSVMSAPATMVLSKLLLPETEVPVTVGGAELPKVESGENLLDAATLGTTDGLKLSLNVAAMLIAFISLVAVVDWLLGGIDAWVDRDWLKGQPAQMNGHTEYLGIVPGSLATFFGKLFAPIAFILGCPWKDCTAVGNLLGTKICLNEFVAYAELAPMIRDGTISERSQTIASYALCGFANFGSIGIQIGGISALVPERRADLSRLALRAMFGGALASCMTAVVAGMLI